ncbi:metallophosphoesterase [Methanosarcina sp. MSH10X1]|uniref:metallophosphoesterase n=1 Tax=Methanosarcina sp. MSH10X1 TaxID=2507075 RepID=UPI000FFC4291|nr:metallophosphoesterase [Methanosarcina sp. MSH10X1]RXA21913.1 metallophosphoesterase [Methanosarcina sp. MSH10X1]
MTETGKNSRRASSLFLAILIIFVSIYTAGNYYVGLRFFQSIQSFIEPYSFLYWTGYFFLAISLIAVKLGKRIHPGSVNYLVAITGDYWLAAIYYSLLIWVDVDIFHFLIDFAFPEAKIANYPSFYWGFTVLSVVSLLLIYGTWNANHPRVTHYDVFIKKAVSELPELHAAMVSDIHLGLVIDNRHLESMVKKINELAPDIVFLVGDTIDEDVRFFINGKIPETLKKLQPEYGVYAVLGNHEYIGGRSKQAIEYLRQAGVNVLVDECVKVNNQFYVAGRDDRMASHMAGKTRIELSGLLEGIDHNLPIILLDHQPVNLGEGQRNGVDLQLSGHTHAGQFFPNTLISRHVFENSWGYLKKGESQIIVTSGFGTWGPPIRIGSYSEIVDISISFLE